MNINDKICSLKTKLLSFENWEMRYDYIIELGMQLPKYSQIEDKYLISGCQSRVWIMPEKDGDQLFLHGDSDALISKGLLALLLNIYNGQSFDDILKIDSSFLQELEILDHLSMNRTNGLLSMNRQIKLYATALKALH